MTKIIKGSGGGGKSGGGSSRVAVEAPDSLRSKQYARVIDAVSEGEIQGLVNGLQSVYLDDTPIQNSNGSFNFDGVVFDTRNGTQSQSHIDGFPAVEAESPVSVEVTQAAPVVRTITNSENDAVRITVSVPRLTKQDTTNGDISGTSVTIGIDVQSDGGGYVPAKLSTITNDLSWNGSVLSSLTAQMIDASITVNWTGLASTTYQTASYRVDYRAVGDVTWIPLSNGSFSGTGYRERVRPTTLFWLVYNYVTRAPSSSRTVSFAAPADDAYEFKVTLLSGVGSLSLSGKYNGWIGTDTITGKTSSRYQRSYTIPLTGSPPWDIRVRRVTEDSTSQALQNKTYWDSYTELVNSKFGYPNTALMAISIDAERFNNIPTRGYEIEGLIIKVPSNYNPLTREYTGIWDGTFTTAYSNNPAWCFYDLVTNSRYGLGAFIDQSLVDKWALYEIAQYCDELVDDGLGGLEPRFTCNIYIQDRAEAYKVLEAMASAFNAMSYWSGGAITAVQDSPKSPTALFTPANVIGGAFNYSGSSAKTRHSVVLVTWNDPEDRYRQSIEYVADEASIARYGIIQKDVVAVGCTSRGQAHRFGKAVLFSEQMETETVTFKTGLDGLSVAVGDVIQTSDPVRAGERLGGRFVSATTSVFTLDSEITIDGTSTYTLWALMPDGTVESSTITTGASTTTNITISPAFSDTPLVNSIWVIGSSSLLPETWRVLSIVESDSVNAEITALEYRSDKYAAIEQDVILEPRPTSSLRVTPDAPTDFIAEESLYLISSSLVGVRLTASWNGNAQYYEIQYRPENGNWQTLTTSSNAIDIQPVTAGTYNLRLTAISAIGLRSQSSYLSTVIYGLTIPPASVGNFQLQAIAGNAHLTWDQSTDLDVLVGGYIKIRHTDDVISPSWSNAVDIGGIIAGNSTSATLPLVQGSYLAKFIDSTGNQSPTETIITTTAPSILALNTVESVVENPDFLGSKTNTYVDSGILSLESAETIDDQLIFMDTWPRLSAIGGIATSGEYLFNTPVDLGSIQTSRITAQILASGFDVLDLIDERPLISAWASVDGAIIDDVDASIYIRQSDDNVTFGNWLPFSVGDYTARAFEFKAVLSTSYETHNIQVSELSITVDMPDRIESGDDIASGAATKSITYSKAFMGLPAVGITAQDMQTGDYYSISNKTLSGFDIIFKNSSGTTVDRTFDYIARAY